MKLFIAVVLACASISAYASPSNHDGKPLPLTTSQVANLRTLLALSPSTPFTVAVLDSDANHRLNAGDVAVVNGGFTNGEISRRILSRADVASINGKAVDPLAQATRQLQAAEAKWKKKRPLHYSYALQRSCFCAPDYRKPIAIRVFRGKVQQASLLPEGTPLPAERKAEALPVEGLFRLVREAIANKAASVVVVYDARYGYPTSISIDRDRMMADEEIHLAVSHFNVASGLKPK